MVPVYAEFFQFQLETRFPMLQSSPYEPDLQHNVEVLH